MKLRMVASGLALILLTASLASAKDTPDKKREKARKMADATLEDLYKLQPTSKEAVQKAAG